MRYWTGRLLIALGITLLVCMFAYYDVYGSILVYRFQNDCADVSGHIMSDGGPSSVCVDSSYNHDLFRAPVMWPMHNYPGASK